jgi:8-oxo-dGTP diphosphatase
MPLPHRIAAGAIVFKEDTLLLVRYAHPAGGSYLVAPGGAVHQAEPLADAAVRETLEETGLTVAARHPLAVEDLLFSRYRMCKMWFYCEVVAGDLHETAGAKQEGITQAAWFARDALRHETVYPPILLQYDWQALASSDWAAKWLALRRANI